MKQIAIVGKESIQIGKKTFILEERKMNDVLAMNNFALNSNTKGSDSIFMMAIVVKDAMKYSNRKCLFFKYSANYIMKTFTSKQLNEAFKIVVEDLEGGKIDTSKKKKVKTG